ncbi:MAG: hypothetical protein KDD51_12065 [Bdellovibrionales bacterium]|nr:hypothetical protein [Bdellovibrionales bacterium]
MDPRLWNLFVVFLLVLTLNLAREGFDVDKRKRVAEERHQASEKPRTVERVRPEKDLKLSRQSF